MPPIKGGPHCRLSSPRGGGSTLTTSAPMSASNIEHTGPDKIRERSTTKTSSSAFIRTPVRDDDWPLVSVYFLPLLQNLPGTAYQLCSVPPRCLRKKPSGHVT